MITQWVNRIGWFALISAPSYITVVKSFPELIKPAFSAIAIYIPLMTFFPFIKWLVWGVNDTKDLKDSLIQDASGINLTPVTEGVGKFTCEIAVCKEMDKGKPVIVPEIRRFESTLIMGGSGARKDNNSNRANDCTRYREKVFL